MATLNTASISKGDSKKPNSTFVLFLLGSSVVGKSCLKNRLIRRSFYHAFATFGIEFNVYTIKIDALTIGLNIWDMCGAEAFSSIVASQYGSADAAIVVYDITNMHTFLRAQMWVKELQCQVSPNIVIALSGNKADLSHEREVSFEEAQVYAKENQLLFMETSAKMDMNVTDIFEAVVLKLCRIHKENNTILLYLASKKGNHVEVLRLLEEGADVNIERSSDGWSPLMVASQNGHFDVVLALNGAGAKVNHINKDGWSPLMVASQHGHFDVVLALIGAGAKVNCTNKDRNKALDIAVKNGHNDVADVLNARQTEIFSVIAQKVHDIKHHKKQSEQQLHDMMLLKERTERELHDLRQLNEKTVQQLQDTRKAKKQIEQKLHDMKQQKEKTELLLQDVRQQLETAESTVLKQKIKNKLLKQELCTTMHSPITQTANFMDYNQTDSSVLENSSDDDKENQ